MKQRLREYTRAQKGLWLDSETPESGGGAGKESVFVMNEQNAGYRPFEAVKTPEREPVRPAIEPQPQISEPAKELVFPMSPLIQSQRSQKLDQDSVSERQLDPKQPSLEIGRGALLHCRLTAPVFSDQGDAPVQAELTRALVRRGRVILPPGTRMRGELRDEAEENRIHFKPMWEVELSSGGWDSIQGQVQQAAIDRKIGRHLLDDGQAGLPGMAEDAMASAVQKRQDALRIVATAARIGLVESIANLDSRDRSPALNPFIDEGVRMMASREGHPVAPVKAGRISVWLAAGEGFYLLTERQSR